MYSYECIRSLSSHVGYNFEQACIKLKVQSVYYVRCLSYHMTQMGLFKWNYSGAFLYVIKVTRWLKRVTTTDCEK